VAAVAHLAGAGCRAGSGGHVRGPHPPSPRPPGRTAALFRSSLQRRCRRDLRLLHGLRGHALGRDAAVDPAVALLGPAGRRQHRARPHHGRDRFALLGPAVGALRSSGNGRGRRRAFRRGWGLAAGQRRSASRLCGGPAAQPAAVGGGQRADPAFAVRLRRRRAASRTGVGVGGAGRGTPGRFGSGRGDLRGCTWRPPGGEPGRIRPCLDCCPDHRGHHRLRRARHRSAADRHVCCTQITACLRTRAGQAAGPRSGGRRWWLSAVSPGRR